MVEEDRNASNSIDIGIGMNIGQKQIDDIEDMQSPPNSPGLVLPGTVPSTNDKIDFFALDSVIDSHDQRKEKDAPLKSTSSTFDTIDSKASKSQRKLTRVLPLQSDYNEDKDGTNSDINLNLNITASSDSYFSRSRRGSNLNTPKQVNTLRNRRTSDVSDRSDGSFRSETFGSVASSGSFDSGSNITESDTDVSGSPLARYSRKRSKFKPGMESSMPAIKISSEYEKNNRYDQYDDGIVYRTFSHASDSDSTSDIGYGMLTPRSGSRSSSRGRIRGKGNKDDKEKEENKEGDSSSTAQIFKNMLILEESLRQQYIQQQNLRFQYGIFLFVLTLTFIYSTYSSIFSDYDGTVGFNQVLIGENDGVFIGDDSIDIPIQTDNGIVSITYKSSIVVPEFPTFAKMEPEGKNILDGNDDSENIHPTREDESRCDIYEDVNGDERYTLMRIVYRVISIITFMTLLLFYLTGEYTRTISRPRKFLITANKGVRQLNVRLVKVKVGIKDQFIGFIRRRQNSEQRRGVEHIRMVLNPRVFSTATREQWELYRNQFWDLESIRRIDGLRQR